MSPGDPCERCKKPRAICVCDRIAEIPTAMRVLILQHPQEDDVTLGTAPLIAASLPRAQVKVGLSWASLSHAAGEELDHARWAVVYPTKIAGDVPPAARARPFLLLDKKGHLRPPGAPPIEGVVALDGTWSQAKTLWWRNPWLLKLARIVLQPSEPSIYGRLRKEPRREHISTLEAIADALIGLGEPESTREQLRRTMRTMVQRARDASKRGEKPAP